MRLHIIKNRIIPWGGIKYIVIVVWLFCHKEPSERDYRHENIHLQQELEMLFIFFWLWYGIEWLVRWISNGFDAHKAYHSISFEEEAYMYQDEEDYLDWREHFTWADFI